MCVFTGVCGWWLPHSAIWWQMSILSPITEWVGHHVFGVDAVLQPDSRSGDQTAMWVFVFILLVFAVAATALWSVLDRRRTHYQRLHAWLLVFLRLCVGGPLLYFGAIKAIPVQMPAPPLTTLLRPYGQLSPNWVLWLQVGSSYPYEIALGVVELVAGALLFWPRTAALGALLALASMAQVFLFNMTFDVSVKILSFHLLVLTLVLLAPQAKRLANMFVLQRPSQPAAQPALFGTPHANKIATAVQIAVGSWVLVGSLTVSWLVWSHYGGGRPKPDLYGIWTVADFTVDGPSLPPHPTRPLATADHRRSRQAQLPAHGRRDRHQERNHRRSRDHPDHCAAIQAHHRPNQPLTPQPDGATRRAPRHDDAASPRPRQLAFISQPFSLGPGIPRHPIRILGAEVLRQITAATAFIAALFVAPATAHTYAGQCYSATQHYRSDFDYAPPPVRWNSVWFRSTDGQLWDRPLPFGQDQGTRPPPPAPPNDVSPPPPGDDD